MTHAVQFPIEGSLAQTPISMSVALQSDHHLDAVRAEGGGDWL
jgi:hypothetical protein